MGRYSEGSLFQRFPNPTPTNPTNPKVGNLRNNEPSEYRAVTAQPDVKPAVSKHTRRVQSTCTKTSHKAVTATCKHSL